MTGPLAGVRILDLTQLLPGPLCTRHLADLGAEVIKLEPPEGDPLRRMAPAGLFEDINRGKASIALDLKRPEGVEIALRLAEAADVLVEGFRPGVTARLGLGWEAVRARNPRLVYCSITGYGQDGPYRDRPGHDINYLAITGVLQQSANPAGPAVPALQVADIAGGSLAAALGILAALMEARRSGRGRHVDVAMAEAVLAQAVVPLASARARGEAPPPGGDTLTGALPWYRVYACADGRHLAVGALEERFWRRLCEALGRPEWADAHCGDEARRSEVAAALEALFATRSRDAWAAELADAGCCVTPVLDPLEAAADPHFAARGVGGEAAGRVPPLRLDGRIPRRPGGAPALGAHGPALLVALGYDREAVAALRAAGVVHGSDGGE
ncbi:CaiB/BaiF CoA transferase family protein [Inmirania thermothiophila]|uniref:Crotonobetainyl-CoA:carnitine CoA-transferase CaiB-like acyl-CoA transferase n=1 Tax=Inmirania thermothiophila TaxID=1750597 RepID=A0A3N1XZF8_9GAMM|nr:CaiB/BaiF CoA-transferase family protein [Inmirania thermothiophila]ROR31959.1 crotonobetainyl-CoA:carnitine CoA-transferase CaiB-like acyl-CoA transferase [Inmirania thermothiophila]